MYDATTMFMGFDVTNGATPAAGNTANANGVNCRSVYGGRTNASTSGVSSRIAASLVSRADTTKLRANTLRKSRGTDRARLAKTRCDTRSMTPIRRAADVVIMMATIV